MAGPLKTLFGALQASTFLAGVSLVYGEELVQAQDQALPLVVLVPVGGPIDNNPGYVAGLDPAVEMVWGVRENVDLYLWAGSGGSAAIDNVDATETLFQQVLSALRDQQAQYTDVVNVAFGLAWKPVSRRWETLQNAVNRYGRALVVTVSVEISVPMSAPQEATINTYQLNQTITQGPA